MKKIILLVGVVALFTVQTTLSWASGGDHEGRGNSWKHHRHHRDQYYPSGQYYGPPPQPVYQDPRSHQGLAGGVMGSVLGYELGNGNPVATGIGAAAGSFIGNGVSGRR